MKKIILWVLLLAFLSGCVHARVWHKTDSDKPTKEEEVKTAVAECEKTRQVGKMHRHALTWRYISIATVWIPYVNIATWMTCNALAGNYETDLITCMQQANFNCISHRTGRLKWDALSDFDVSMEEWEKREKK